MFTIAIAAFCVPTSSAQAHVLHAMQLPKYPPLAYVARIQRTVKLNVTVGVEGEVTRAGMVSGPSLLARYALENIETWKFEPLASNNRMSPGLSSFIRSRERQFRSPRSLNHAFYFPANSFFTASLTTFPSTRIPAAANLAMAFFMTVPMSFIVGDPISAMVAFTPAMISSSPAAFGR